MIQKLVSMQNIYVAFHLYINAPECGKKPKLTSAAASISACQTFLPCPNMTEAHILALYFPDIKSAALRKTLALV